MPFMPQTALLRPDVWPALESISANAGQKTRNNGVGRSWVCPKLEGSSYQLLTREMERWNPCEIGYAPVAWG
jgi:hypothetical protein